MLNIISNGKEKTKHANAKRMKLNLDFEKEDRETSNQINKILHLKNGK